MAAPEFTASARIPKAPFLGASALLCAAAVLIGVVAIRPLGAAELLGLLVCVGAASACATIPFVIDFTRRLDATRAPAAPAQISAAPAPAPAPAPQIDSAQLAAQVAEIVEARLAAAEDRRRAELQAALAAATPARPVDSDTVSAPAGAKPRLGRGLLGLMHAPGAIAAKPADPEEDRAAA